MCRGTLNNKLVVTILVTLLLQACATTNCYYVNSSGERFTPEEFNKKYGNEVGKLSSENESLKGNNIGTSIVSGDSARTSAISGDIVDSKIGGDVLQDSASINIVNNARMDNITSIISGDSVKTISLNSTKENKNTQHNNSELVFSRVCK